MQQTEHIRQTNPYSYSTFVCKLKLTGGGGKKKERKEILTSSSFAFQLIIPLLLNTGSGLCLLVTCIPVTVLKHGFAPFLCYPFL